MDSPDSNPDKANPYEGCPSEQDHEFCILEKNHEGEHTDGINLWY